MAGLKVLIATRESRGLIRYLSALGTAKTLGINALPGRADEVIE